MSDHRPKATAWDPGKGVRLPHRANRVALEVNRGDTLSFARQAFVNTQTGMLTSIDPVTEPGPPPGPWAVQNLTGWHCTFTAKYHFGDPDNQAPISLDNAAKGGVLLVNPPAAGKVAVTVPAIATRGFPDGVVTLVWDMQVVDPSGNVRTIAAGVLGVFPDVTNALT